MAAWKTREDEPPGCPTPGVCSCPGVKVDGRTAERAENVIAAGEKFARPEAAKIVVTNEMARDCQAEWETTLLSGGRPSLMVVGYCLQWLADRLNSKYAARGET